MPCDAGLSGRVSGTALAARRAFPAPAGWVCVSADARLDVVGRVDPDDDSLRRYIVRHYRYDPVRRERRHVVVAAFGSRWEFWACLDAISEEIRRRYGGAGPPASVSIRVSMYPESCTNLDLAGGRRRGVW